MPITERETVARERLRELSEQRISLPWVLLGLLLMFVFGWSIGRYSHRVPVNVTVVTQPAPVAAPSAAAPSIVTPNVSGAGANALNTPGTTGSTTGAAASGAAAGPSTVPGSGTSGDGTGTGTGNSGNGQ